MRQPSEQEPPAHATGRVSYDALPALRAPFTDFMSPADLAERSDDEAATAAGGSTRAFSRRSFLRSTATVGLVALGFSVIDVFGRSGNTVAYAAHGDDFGYLQWGLGKCAPVNYVVTCSVGCYLGTSAIGSQYCADERIFSRHRGHIETEFFDTGRARMHAIRPDHCYGGYDGWQWSGTDDRSNCGCPDEPRFSCSGGWARYLVDGQLLSWYHTTCQQADCGA